MESGPWQSQAAKRRATANIVMSSAVRTVGALQTLLFTKTSNALKGTLEHSTLAKTRVARMGYFAIKESA